MGTLAAIEQLFAFEEWANERTLRTLQSLEAVDSDLTGVFAHILSGKRTWLDRIEGIDPGSPGGWPHLTLAECESRNAEVNDAFHEFFNHLQPEGLDRTVVFPWSKGDLKTPLREVLSHLVTHGMYHRGEIMAGAGQAGVKVPSTDYVIWWNKTHPQG